MDPFDIPYRWTYRKLWLACRCLKDRADATQAHIDARIAEVSEGASVASRPGRTNAMPEGQIIHQVSPNADGKIRLE